MSDTKNLWRYELDISPKGTRVQCCILRRELPVGTSGWFLTEAEAKRDASRRMHELADELKTQAWWLQKEPVHGG